MAVFSWFGTDTEYVCVLCTVCKTPLPGDVKQKQRLHRAVAKSARVNQTQKVTVHFLYDFVNKTFLSYTKSVFATLPAVEWHSFVSFL